MRNFINPFQKISYYYLLYAKKPIIIPSLNIIFLLFIGIMAYGIYCHPKEKTDTTVFI